MLEVDCAGLPHEIGLQHGRTAQEQIKRGLVFYHDLFLRTAQLQWPAVCKMAKGFLPLLERDWVPYVQEMKGVAEGAGVDFESILAMNVRTEIAYGMFSDGCTALSWKVENASFLAQNWDWEHEQKENLILLRIHHTSKPAIHMITEAGIIGKIGLNSAGMGVCLNAIRARGVDFNKLPCHLSLRAALESPSRVEAVLTLERAGVASACHILIADATGGMGLECSSQDIYKLPMRDGKVLHTNHFVVDHAGIEDKMQLKDSPFRIERIQDLVSAAEKEYPVPKAERVEKLLEDEMNYPTAICRAKTDDSTVATLFSIVMDLKAKTAKVRLGRPCEPEDTLFLSPAEPTPLNTNGHANGHTNGHANGLSS